jgi:predicted transcriptional regulator
MNSSKLSLGFPHQTHALLSIRPQHADAILRGDKRYEFRRTIFSRHVDIVIMYVTAPVGQVVAEFDVVSVINEQLLTLWKRTRQHAGINMTFFLAYFKGCKTGHAIEIGEVRLYNEPFCPIKRLGLRPPQSFVYL